MASSSRQTFSRGIYAYISAVAVCGALTLALSVQELAAQGSDYRSQWMWLVSLTVVSGLLPVTIRSFHITISISETFVIAGALLFGRSGGTVLVFLDALFISIYLFWVNGIKWQQVLFNLGSSPLSIWLAATFAGIEPLFKETEPRFGLLIIQLTAFTALYFLFNTWLLTIALSLQQRVRPTDIWWRNFHPLLLNYAAGGSIAALLVFNTREVRPEFLLAILPLLLVMFFTYHLSNKRIEAERERNVQLNRVFLSTIEALALAIDAKDQVTHGHIRRVQRYTMALADALGVKDQQQLDAIRAGALLHDTGKLAVPEYILNKPGPLTPSEYERMKVHADVGADILKSIDFPYPVEPIVRHHHENWDGTGYPQGLRGQEIPLGARILSVVDCYDALTSDRPYRPRYSRQHSEQVLRERRGSWYDPWVVDEFLKILDPLEKAEAEEEIRAASGQSELRPAADQLDVISATTAEEREFNELRRELPLANNPVAAAEVLFRHLRRVLPAVNFTLFMPAADVNELVVVACAGVGTTAIEGLHIPVGERISGWALAHKQAVVNSNAALELGPVARTFSTPLRYAIAVPILNGPHAALGVITCYGSEPFQNDHRRLLESAAVLFAASITSGVSRSAGHSQASDSLDRRIH
jgi:putative nucleotidyltransferase with HDIG domain